MKIEMSKSCLTCQYLDEWFGDCCHPKAGKDDSLTKAIDECMNKDYAWWAINGVLIEEEKE